MKFNKKIKIVRLNIKRVQVLIKYWIFIMNGYRIQYKEGKKCTGYRIKNTPYQNQSKISVF